MSYPKTMYKVTFSSIEPVTVTGDSEFFLMVRYQRGTRREAKKSTNCSFHETWEEAKAFIVAKQEQEVFSLRSQLERANGRLGQLRGMNNPDSPPL